MIRSINDIVSPPVKIIFIFINGVEHLPPHRVLLDARKLKNWHRMLEEMTKAIKVFPVKQIFTARSGIPIRDFLELDNFGYYVVSDSRDYIKLENGYMDQRCKVKYINPYSNCALWLKNLQTNLTHIRPDLIVIYVYKNNEPLVPAKKFVFTKIDLQNWKKTLEHIARTLDFPSETIKFLYTTDGQKICGSWELQHGACYVGVEYLDKFVVNASYKEQISTSSCKWKIGVPYFYKPKFEHCFHKTPDIYRNSWKCNINWKHFNQRYADFLEDCGTNDKNAPRRPKCDCPALPYYKKHHRRQSGGTHGRYRKFEEQDDAVASDDDVSEDSLKICYV